MARIARDFALILAARLLRAFGFGMAAVLVGLHLERRGLSAGAIGVILTIGLLSAAISGVLAAALVGDGPGFSAGRCPAGHRARRPRRPPVGQGQRGAAPRVARPFGGDSLTKVEEASGKFRSHLAASNTANCCP